MKNMKTRYIIAFAAAALVLAGCSRSDIVSPADENGGMVRFRIGGLQLKGTLINSEDEMLEAGVKSFMVQAWNADYRSFVASQQVSYDEASEEWELATPQSWTGTDTKTFFAYTNLPESGATVVNTFTNEAQKQTLTYTLPLDARQQNDIMLGCYSGTGDGASTASINFVHPLSSIVLRKGEMDVEAITKVVISGIYASGTVDVTYAVDGEGKVDTTCTWGSTRTGAVAATLLPMEDEDEIEVDSEDGTIGTPFIVIPQTVAANQVKITVTATVEGEEKNLAIKIPAGELVAGETKVFTLGYYDPTQTHFIDLGLPSGTLWADRNLGAGDVTDPGNHYAWGETNARGTAATAYSSYWTGGINSTYSALTAKTRYDLSYWKWYISSSCSYPYGYLHIEDDAASMIISSSSTPSKSQWNELITYCNISKEGNGWWLKSNINGRKIYIPANGYYCYDNGECIGESIGRTAMGHYWTNTKGSSSSAYRFGIENLDKSIGVYNIYAGMGIRPVKARSTDASAVTFIDLGLPSGTLWAEVNLGATAKTGWGSIGKFYSFGETNAFGEPVSPYLASWTGNTNAMYLTLSNKTQYHDSNYYKWNGTDRYNSGSLKPEDDAATVLLGEGCKVPSGSDWQELYNNCLRAVETIDGITYIRFTSTITGYTGKSILLPYAGLVTDNGEGVTGIGTEGDYWVSEVYDTERVYRFKISLGKGVLMNDMAKTYGVNIRAVKKTVPEVE